MRNFAKKSKVILKKGNKPGVITDAVGLRQWKVKLVGTDGRLYGAELEKTSQQLRHPVDDEYPDSPVPSSSSGSSADSSGPDYRWENHLKPNVSDCTDGSTAGESSTGVVVDDPDDLIEEVPIFLHDVEYGEEIALEPNDLVAARGIELDDDKHKAKWDVYTIEKEKLVAEKWTVKRKPPSQQELQIGCKVKERRKGGRVGRIIEDDRDEGGKPCWSILFEGEPEVTPNVPSTKISQIKDKRVFVWEAVEDSVPDNPVDSEPYATTGVVGTCGLVVGVNSFDA
ncbi:hypothetical protein SEMRO_1980_G309150.1 [Seminavis robusta]|uniref:Uncharacterized protein n=1 Tax=Seminavis robusta TaxID=568900 RepID=A0A9N8EZ16_9STRA|nr:hypothetical protein SEMRO_1980_G309150.1 [Seminavis robusta]|eukprot:Sro1980_g309150.1 n/a (283) ;mRNA; f:14736-15678